MFSKALSAVAVALAASSMVSAQTFTECNPTQKTCPADPAFGKEQVNCDLTKGECKAFKALDGTTVKYADKGAIFKIEKDTNAPTITTSKYIFFGRVDIELQAAAGPGIITSTVLQSDDLDEIDWEWTGGDNARVQSNYFSKGDTTTWDRGGFHPVSNPLNTFHTYSVEWTKKAVNWIIDDKVVRTLSAADAKGKFPQSPMQVKVGTWVAGREGAPKGTIEWAGGLADFSKGPALAYYKSIKIVDYAGGDGPTDKAIKSYTYGDKSGSAESIKIEEGNNDDTKSSKPASSQASTSGTPKSTGTGSPSTTLATASSSPTSASSSKPTAGATTVPSTGAAPRTGLAVGSIILAAGAIFAQLL